MSLVMLVLLTTVSIFVVLAVTKFLFARRVANDMTRGVCDEGTFVECLSDHGGQEEVGWGGLLGTIHDDWLPTSDVGGAPSRSSDSGAEAEWRF